MKTIKKIAVATALMALAALPAAAQIDQFGQTTVIVLAAPQLISGATATLITNTPIDTHGFDGVAVIDIFSNTNAAGGTLTAGVEVSNDTTNWTGLANYARSVAATVTYTNTYYGTQLKSTNSALLPGTLTSATAATAGFAGTYLLPSEFTNTAATVTVTASGYYRLAFSAQDQPRYMRIIFGTGGTATNSTAGALYIGRKGSGVR